MPRILVIDDEPTLRVSMARGLSRLEGSVVQEAGNLKEALAVLDSVPPDVIVSDIDLPDRSGIEILGELGRRGLSVPVIFVSAYLKAFRSQIPRHGNFEALEKPVTLEHLRERVRAKLGVGEEQAPFSVADYLQLACLGRHSVRISAKATEGDVGEILVCDGEAWFAGFGSLVATEAFAAIAFRQDLQVSCGRVHGDLPERNLEGSVDGLLMDAARLFDERNRDAPEEVKAVVRRYSDPPSSEGAGWDEPAPREKEKVELEPAAPESSAADRMFQRHWEVGVDALLVRDFVSALEAFRTAHAIDPENQSVIANLERLKAMGIEEGKAEEET